MLIGELAEQTGTSERLLRYYERAGLLRPERLPNGYREYADSDTDAVLRIRALLAAGLPTRVIRHVLPCTMGGQAAGPGDRPRADEPGRGAGGADLQGHRCRGRRPRPPRSCCSRTSPRPPCSPARVYSTPCGPS
ncbi:MerR family transcriptional regulator [Streptomyces sp. NBC_01288]|uniref:MerR family transcriptional regulator n=1 Tax=Streptomyces sp. NBC_01288 TaxID=2903814 RepID=UPI003FA36754